jgi:hypothetical protein
MIATTSLPKNQIISLVVGSPDESRIMAFQMMNVINVKIATQPCQVAGVQPQP